MPSIISVPESRTRKVKLKLSKKGLVVDSRVIGLDSEGHRFECNVSEDILTIKRTDHYSEDGWDEELYFRLYDTEAESIPDFTSGNYNYHGLDNEKPPFNVVEVVVDQYVKVIKEGAFANCKQLRKCTMHDTVERIEDYAFFCCEGLENVRLSRSIRYIGERVFFRCISIKCLFLPPSVEDIQREAFSDCKELRILILPPNIDMKRIGNRIVQYCRKLLTDKSIQYEKVSRAATNDDKVKSWLINHWLKHRYDNLPLVRLCANPDVTAQRIYIFIEEHGTDPVFHTDDTYGFTPLHILTHYNGFASEDTVMACAKLNPGAIFSSDRTGFTPVDNLCTDKLCNSCIAKESKFKKWRSKLRDIRGENEKSLSSDVMCAN